MKSKEAPEKIYIFETDLQREDHRVMYGINQDNNIHGLVEYTRTDVFIEKAVEWIDKNAFRYIVTRKYQGLDVTGLDASLAADFKKALEDIL